MLCMGGFAFSPAFVIQPAKQVTRHAPMLLYRRYVTDLLHGDHVVESVSQRVVTHHQNGAAVVRFSFQHAYQALQARVVQRLIDFVGDEPVNRLLRTRSDHGLRLIERP